MLFSNMRRVAFGIAVAGLFLSQAALMAQHHGGGHGKSGHHGGGHHGGGHHGGGHHGGIHHHHHDHGHFGGGYGHINRGFYGSNLYSGRGFSISIGSGYPYGYSGFGYGSLGYGGLGYGGLGYGGLSDSYRYPATGYSPIYRGSTYYGSAYPGFSYDTAPAYGGSTYPYESSIEPQYGVPGYDSEFRHQPSAETPYSVGRVDPSSSDLRAGMVLPDGSTVISVGPLDGPVVSPGTELNSENGSEMPTEAAPLEDAESDTELVPLPPQPDEATNLGPTKAPSLNSSFGVGV
ncbi:secreted protein [Rhodopirellula maiorica SM1]|uniref:Secreted protein n=1 Tax=Rhodopirellula maiorica SM1 TaxID=1265738 RepID=M5RZB2_9BACT|nr:hypothetical protein [Rhodopirellula maiorica]EMI20732.1 secreted protein [Rhodopirellula maiorica SM1]